MRSRIYPAIFAALVSFTGCAPKDDASVKAELESLKACAEMAKGGLLQIAETRDRRFLAKVQEATAVCRGGAATLPLRVTPWVDWANYWGAADARSRMPAILKQAGALAPDE